MTLSLLLLAAVLAADSSADEAAEKLRRAEVAKLAPAKAKQVEMLVGKEKAKTKLHVEPLLRWSNPTAGSVHGEVYLWSHQGRPAAVASIYRWWHPHKDSTFEVVSVCESPLKATEDEKLLWESPEAGLKFQALPDAPAPDARPAARLTQMRTLARRFTAVLADKRNGDEVRRELRLLNQPVHRYSSVEQHVIDGALLAFVETTDPEVWLLLEAVAEGERKSWRFALARMNADAMEVALDGKPVQSWPKIVQPWKYRSAPYTLLGFDPSLVKLDELLPPATK
jgi:hypothetical protein